MKIEVIQLSKNSPFKITINGEIIFPDDYIGYEDFGRGFDNENDAISFAKRMMEGELTKIYPRTVFVGEVRG
jgi:hypothetical protein